MEKPVNHLSKESKYYEIRVKGQLDQHWSNWLDDLEITFLDESQMTLCGVIEDQAALIGVINKLNSLNMVLMAVNIVN